MNCIFTYTPCFSPLQNPWSLHFVLLQWWTSNMAVWVEMFSFLIKLRMTWTGYFHSWDLIARDLWCLSYVPTLVFSSDLFSFPDTSKCLLSKTLVLRSNCGVVRIRTHARGKETQQKLFSFLISRGMMFFLPWQYNPDLNLWELWVFRVLMLSVWPVWSSLESLTWSSSAELLGGKDKEGEASVRAELLTLSSLYSVAHLVIAPGLRCQLLEIKPSLLMTR